MPLVDFKAPASDALCRAWKGLRNKPGDPSSDQQKQSDTKKYRRPTIEIPQAEFQHDGFNHMPILFENRDCCTYPECSRKSCIACLKCCVSLCFSKGRTALSRFMRHGWGENVYDYNFNFFSSMKYFEGFYCIFSIHKLCFWLYTTSF
jgi:hypothetical protein